MSDGERVCLYLIGSVLLATLDTVVIEEPETHLHPALLPEMWDLLERQRSDLTFIYLTHDLTFASTRRGAAKVVLTDFDRRQGEPHWCWFSVPRLAAVPEDVWMRVAGSRRHTLFVEGKRGGLDEKIYAALFPEADVIPCGGCGAVIRSVAALKQHSSLHRSEVRGIIDLDERGLAEVGELSTGGVECLRLAHVENILLLPRLIRVVADHLCVSDADETLHSILAAVRLRFEDSRERATSARAKALLLNSLRRACLSGCDRATLSTEVQAFVGLTRVDDAFDRAEREFGEVFSQRSEEEFLGSALRIFRDKGAIPLVASQLGVETSRYIDICVHKLTTSESLHDDVLLATGLASSGQVGSAMRD